jgi:hypothetical protein
MIAKATLSLTEQLTKLAKLHADGVLTDEQFKSLKTRLIAGLKETIQEEQATGDRAAGAEKAAAAEAAAGKVAADRKIKIEKPTVVSWVNRSIKMGAIAAITLMALGGVVAFFGIGSSSSPDCGSRDTFAVIEQKSKDNVIMQYTATISLLMEITAIQNPNPTPQKQDELDKAKMAMIFSASLGELGWQALMQEAPALADVYKKVQGNFHYSLDEIRTVAKNHDTGAVSCVGRLVGELSGTKNGIKTTSWSTPISYTVELTSDSKIYVTVLSWQ